MVLSQKLKVLRKKMGLSQLELSEKLLVSRQAVSGWEAGTSKPSVENLQCLSRLYQVSLEDLLDDAREVAVPADAQVPAKPDTEQAITGRDVKKWKTRKWVLIAAFFFVVSLLFVFLYVNERSTNKNEYNIDELEVEKGVAPAEKKFDLTWE